MLGLKGLPGPRAGLQAGSGEVQQQAVQQSGSAPGPGGGGGRRKEAMRVGSELGQDRAQAYL